MGVGDASATGQPPALDWRGAVPLSRRFDDPYFSLDDGVAESVHVFLGGNGLPQAFRPGMRIAELGFGTGLNCAVALLAWRAAGQAGPLRYTGFEACPVEPGDIARALAGFAATAPLAEAMAQTLAGNDAALGDLDLELVTGDARQTLAPWAGAADAWFLDGFAPARNPEMWEAGLMREVARHTRPGGTFATYTAAGAVRRALDEAGFEVTRVPGYGRKRHMTRGALR